jgi:hypothetical protein
VPDAASEVALEAAQGFHAALAFGLLAGEVRDGGWVMLALGDGDPVQRGVELAIAAAVEALTVAASGGRGDRSGPALAGEVLVGREALGAGGATDDRGGRDHAAAFQRKQAGPLVSDQALELALERLDGAGEFPDATQFIARDPHARGLLQRAQAPRDPIQPHGTVERAGRDLCLQLGVELEQVPAQAALHAGAL